jgi:hypothetical protein
MYTIPGVKKIPARIRISIGMYVHVLVYLYVACICIFKCVRIEGGQRDILAFRSPVMEHVARRASSLEELQTEVQPELLRGVPLDAWNAIILS